MTAAQTSTEKPEGNRNAVRLQRERAAAPGWAWKRRLTLTLARSLVPVVLRALGRSWRYELPAGTPPGAFTRPPEAAVYAFWHRCLLPVAWLARDRGFGVLVSQHFDGEVISQVAERMGYRLFRGSSTRGGREALEEMRLALAQGQPIALTVDGPRGPRYRAKSGAVQLAKATGAPIYALHLAPERYWELKSWDRFQIPRPFSRIRGYWSGPLRVASEATPAEIEVRRKELEAEIERMRQRSEYR